MRKHVNDSYSSFFCDTLVDATVEPRDEQALRSEGLFPAVLMRVADDQIENKEDAVAFLQAEFIDRNLQMPAACAGKVDKLTKEAENLVLDLLSWGEDQ